MIKDAGAVSMAKKRWKGTTKKQRSAEMTKVINARWAKKKKHEANTR